MKVSQRGIDLIKSFEGCELKAYKDPVGVWTIGYGQTRGVKPGQTITKAQAEAMLKQEVQVYVNGVNGAVKVPLNQNQFDALVSFAYNLGVGALQKSTLLRCVNAKDFGSAGKEFERWNKAGGKVLAGLTRRRKAEMDLFNTPVKKATAPSNPKPKAPSNTEYTVIAGTYDEERRAEDKVAKLKKLGIDSFIRVTKN